jgi:HK97 family phage portal protein
LSLRSIIGEAYDAVQAESPLTSLGLNGFTASGDSTLANPAPWLGEALGAFPGPTGKVVTPQTAMRVSAVYGCVSVLAQSVAQLPLTLYKVSSDGSMNPAKDHPLYSILLSLANPEMTAQDEREMSMNHLLLRGNAFRQVVRSGGEIGEINPMHPDYVRMYRSATGALTYEYTDPWTGQERALRTDQCWRTIGMSFNGLSGVSPIAYARDSIGLAMATEEHGSKLFSNGAQIATAFEHPGIMTEAAQERFMASVRTKYSGSSNAFKSIVLEEGMKVAKLAMTSVDSQFIEARKFQLEEICRIFRVPPHKIQDLARATFNNIEHLSMDFVNSSLMPWLVRFEQTINRDLLLPNERKKYVVRFDADSLQRGDMAARANYYASGIANTWLCPDEARADEFMNKRPDGQGGKFENPNTSTGKAQPGQPVPDPSKG